MWCFIRDHFDKLVLLTMFLSMLVATTHFAHLGDMDSAHWMREKADEVIGALLILMTGIGIRKAVGSNEPPKTP
jgi:hypothetical protein